MTTAYSATTLAAWWAERQHADAVEWTRLSAEAGEWLRDLSGRDDLIAVVEPKSGRGAPAVYIPEMAHVEVNPDVCAPGVAPQDIRLSNEVARLRYPAFAGAAAHEGAHAAFSRWTIDQTPARRRVVQAALLLEEARAEGHLVAQNPEIRVLLRATFHTIVKGASEPGTLHGAAQSLALADARVDAGILAADEVASAVSAAIDLLGLGRYYALRAIWREAQALGSHHDQDAMEALGERWVAVMDAKQDARDEASEQQGEAVMICSMPHEGEGEGDDSPLGDAAQAVSESASDEAEAQADRAAVRDAANARKKEASEQRKNEAEAQDVFKEIKMNGHGYGRGGEGLSGERVPTPSERGQANALAAALRRAQYRDRHTTVVSSAVPPGRLRTQAAMRRDAERAMGMLPTAQPWRQTIRKQVEQPPITVGIACDISGSMRWATDAVASAAWMIANAVHRNEGDSATVAYGESVHAVVRPGETPAVVRTFNATGGMENFTGAMRALDGGLNLSSARGVRVAVFVSDGHYTAQQEERGQVMVTRLMEAGVKVLWVGFHGVGDYRGDRPPKGVTYVHITDPAQMGSLIGQAMVTLLGRA